MPVRKEITFRIYFVGKDGIPRVFNVTDRSIQRYRQNRKTRWFTRNQK